MEAGAAAAAFGRHAARVAERTAAWAADPGPGSARGVRTAARRLEAAWKLLPRRARGGAGSGPAAFRRRCRRLFGLCGPIRDMDAAAERLRGAGEDAAAPLAVLEELRGRALRRARGAASALLAGGPPPGVPGGAGPDAGAQARFEREAVRLIRRMGRDMPAVASDPALVERLHRLRKDCKKLRYLLEVASAPPGEGAPAIPLLAKLKRLQRVLGAVRDCDAAAGCLEDLRKRTGGSPALDAAIRDARRERLRGYERLVSLIRP